MDVNELQARYRELHERYAGVLAEKELQRQSFEAEIERLKLKIQVLNHRLFGKSSERREGCDGRQSSLFEVLAQAQPKKESPCVKVSGYSRRRRQDKVEDEEAPEGTFPEHLRREQVVLEEKPEGVAENDLELMSEKVTERLAEDPAEPYVKRIVRRVYKRKSTGEIYTPAALPHVFGRCKVDESFLVNMAVKKFLWGLPLYRQHQMLKLVGVELNRAMLAEWTIKLGEMYAPVAQAVLGRVRAQEYLHIDETPYRVGRGSHKRGKQYQDGYLWPLLHPEVGVAFVYRRGRSNEDGKAVLGGYQGTVVSDAWDAYESYVGKQRCGWQLCWMHIRRNFVKAEQSNPDRAKEALEFIRQLYQVEAAIKERCIVEPEQVAAYRFVHSEPILAEFKRWLTVTAATPEGLTSDLLSKAIGYVRSRWEAAVLFVRDGNLPMDNGEAERRIRPVKIGLKNYLFCASEVGAQAAAIFYTLIGSALMLGVHPYYYLLDLTKRVYQRGLTAVDLIPGNWKKLYYNEAVPEHLRLPQPP